jgi:hypothetical protein
MSLITMFKSAVRFLPATMCLMLIILTVCQATLMAQGRSQVGCHEVAIIGAVRMPGRFEIPARMRLLGALAIGGGPSERAGKIVRVVHSCQCSPCAENEVRTATTTEYNLSATLAGREDANPLVSAGDLIIVAETEMIFVVGIGLSKKLVYREGVTLSQVIGAFAGAAQYSDPVRVRIHRNPAAGPRPKPLIFSLKAVLENRSEDPVLEPRDIIEISDKAGNFLLSPPPPLFLDSPLIHPSDKPLLVQRKSSNS